MSTMAYATWMLHVDQALTQIADLSHMDIFDWDWYEAYDLGLSPEKAAVTCLNDFGWFVEMEEVN